MIIHKNLAIANDFGIDRQYAINCRRRFLNSEIPKAEDELNYYAWQAAEARSLITCVFAFNRGCEVGKRINEMKAEAVLMRNLTDKNVLEETKIEAARNAPITKVIDFGRGKVRCFNHEDKNPSMYHGTRTNTAVCPVCQKTWDAIAVLMERDGYKFKDAVKALA